MCNVAIVCTVCTVYVYVYLYVLPIVAYVHVQCYVSVFGVGVPPPLVFGVGVLPKSPLVHQ